jgi:hypothetical protein
MLFNNVKKNVLNIMASMAIPHIGLKFLTITRNCDDTLKSLSSVTRQGRILVA